MEKMWVRKSNSYMRKSISAGMLWVVCAVRMAVLQYGYGKEYSVAGIRKEMINGCDNGFGCENPEQNRNRNPVRTARSICWSNA